METFYPEKPRVSCPSLLKTLLHGEKVPKLASRALAGPNSQVGARQLRSWRAKSGLGAPKVSSWRAKTVKLARAKCPPPDPTVGRVGCSVLGRGAEPPQFWVLLIWLEPGISHVTWVHYDATMCLACFVCSVLPVLHLLRFDLCVL